MPKDITNLKPKTVTNTFTPEKEKDYIENYLIPEALTTGKPIREKGFTCIGTTIDTIEGWRRFDITAPSGQSYIYIEKTKELKEVK